MSTLRGGPVAALLCSGVTFAAALVWNTTVVDAQPPARQQAQPPAGDPATLKTVGGEGGEIVRIASAPLGLGVRPPGHLARRCRAGSLTGPGVRVGDEPAATDTARSFPARPPMLPAPPSASSGPFLASRPGSILASAEAHEQPSLAGTRP